MSGSDFFNSKGVDTNPAPMKTPDQLRAIVRDAQRVQDEAKAAKKASEEAQAAQRRDAEMERAWQDFLRGFDGIVTRTAEKRDHQTRVYHLQPFDVPEGFKFEGTSPPTSRLTTLLLEGTGKRIYDWLREHEFRVSYEVDDDIVDRDSEGGMHWYRWRIYIVAGW